MHKPMHSDPTTAPDRARDHGDWLSGLVRQLAADSGPGAVWARVAHAAVAHVDGVQQASITAVRGRSVSTPAATDELAWEVDDRQYTTGEGPCLTSALEHQPVVQVDDLHTERRWPEFRTLVVGLDVRSVLSVQLYTDAATLGALNLYAAEPGAFTATSVRTATMLAAHAAVAADAAATVAQLREAVISRDTIGQAKGILMERYQIDPDRAFAVLVRTSQNHRRKIRDLATQLVKTGELPDSPR